MADVMLHSDTEDEEQLIADLSNIVGESSGMYDDMFGQEEISMSPLTIQELVEEADTALEKHCPSQVRNETPAKAGSREEDLVEPEMPSGGVLMNQAQLPTAATDKKTSPSRSLAQLMSVMSLVKPCSVVLHRLEETDVKFTPMKGLSVPKKTLRKNTAKSSQLASKRGRRPAQSSSARSTPEPMRKRTQTSDLSKQPIRRNTAKSSQLPPQRGSKQEHSSSTSSTPEPMTKRSQTPDLPKQPIRRKMTKSSQPTTQHGSKQEPTKSVSLSTSSTPEPMKKRSQTSDLPKLSVRQNTAKSSQHPKRRQEVPDKEKLSQMKRFCKIATSTPLKSNSETPHFNVQLKRTPKTKSLQSRNAMLPLNLNNNQIEQNSDVETELKNVSSNQLKEKIKHQELRVNLSMLKPSEIDKLSSKSESITESTSKLSKQPDKNSQVGSKNTATSNEQPIKNETSFTVSVGGYVITLEPPVNSEELNDPPQRRGLKGANKMPQEHGPNAKRRKLHNYMSSPVKKEKTASPTNAANLTNPTPMDVDATEPIAMATNTTTAPMVEATDFKKTKTRKQKVGEKNPALKLVKPCSVLLDRNEVSRYFTLQKKSSAALKSTKPEEKINKNIAIPAETSDPKNATTPTSDLVSTGKATSKIILDENINLVEIVSSNVNKISVLSDSVNPIEKSSELLVQNISADNNTSSNAYLEDKNFSTKKLDSQIAKDKNIVEIIQEYPDIIIIEEKSNTDLIPKISVNNFAKLHTEDTNSSDVTPNVIQSQLQFKVQDGCYKFECELCPPNSRHYYYSSELRRHKAIHHKTEPICNHCLCYFQKFDDLESHYQHCVSKGFEVPSTINSEEYVKKVQKIQNIVHHNPGLVVTSKLKLDAPISLNLTERINNNISKNTNSNFCEIIESIPVVKKIVIPVVKKVVINAESNLNQNLPWRFSEMVDLETDNTVKPTMTNVEMVINNVATNTSEETLEEKSPNITTKDPVSNIHSCDICLKKFKTKWYIKLHKANVHSVGKYCKYCKSLVHENYDFQQHLLNCKQSNYATTKTVKDNFEYVLVDEINTAENGNSFEINDPFEEHNESDFFKCWICESKFTSQDLVNMHIINIHNPCNNCKTPFQNVSDLQAHMFECNTQNLVANEKEPLLKPQEFVQVKMEDYVTGNLNSEICEPVTAKDKSDLNQINISNLNIPTIINQSSINDNESDIDSDIYELENDINPYDLCEVQVSERESENIDDYFNFDSEFAVAIPSSTSTNTNHTFLCDICNVDHIPCDKYLEHMASHIILMKCPYCTKLYADRNKKASIRRHLGLNQASAISEYEMVTDETNFRHIQYWCKLRHMSLYLEDPKHHSRFSNVIHCVQCSYKCRYQCQLLRHMIQVHPGM